MTDHLSFKGICIVSCGTLRPELEKLQDSGFLDAKRVLYTAPGLHEWPWELEKQLTKQLTASRKISKKVIVLYGEKCFMDTSNPVRITDVLIREQHSDAVRVRASNCVDMLAGKEEREKISNSKKVYWLTPGWMKHWKYIFKDWDAGKANETFPQHAKAIVLDGVGFYDQFCMNSPEQLLEISDWTRIPIEAAAISLDRLKMLLLEQATQLNKQM